MNLGALKLPQRQHSNGKPVSSFVLLAWHWNWSLTWRWILAWSEWYKPPGTQGFSFMRTHRGRGVNFMSCFNTRLLGHFSLQTQPNMRKNNGSRP